jgi:ribosomal protein L40E
MNQRRASNSTSIGTYAMSRYNITGFRNSRTTSLTIGDLQFIAEGRPYITFRQLGDPNGLARLIKSLKQQQAHAQISGLQVQMQSELVQSEVKEAQTPPESDKAGITCSQCNNSNPHGAQFCNTCGSKLQPGCSKCGTINPEQSKFCNKCGFVLA